MSEEIMPRMTLLSSARHRLFMSYCDNFSPVSALYPLKSTKSLSRPPSAIRTTLDTSPMLSLVKLGINGCAFVVALVLTALALACFTIPPEDPIVASKLTWWNAHSSEYDTLILGTSRLYHGVNPKILDSAAASEGFHLHAYNLSADGMRPPEDDFVLEQALAKSKVRLRWVVVECNEVKLQAPDAERQSPRDIYWHDLHRLAILWRRTNARPYDDRHGAWTRIRTRWGDLGQFVGHVRLSLWRLLRPGSGLSRILMSSKLGQAKLPRPAHAPFSDGYSEWHSHEPLEGRELTDYQNALLRLKAALPKASYGDPESQADLRRKRDLIEQAGATMILVRPPYLDAEVFTPAPALLRVPFLDYSSPRQFPELYTVEVRHDYGHLNSVGAERYSRFLAHEIHRIAMGDARR